MKLKNRIIALAQRAKEINSIENGYFENWEAWNKLQKEIIQEMEAIDKEAGDKLAVGRYLSFGVADGGAYYIITKIRKNDVIVEWIPIYDGYWSQAVGLSSDKKYYIVNRHTAEQQCQRSTALKSIFS
ncbi:MAG TPA: hypothetical protein PKX15_06660 [Bacteroidales bacterium]|nr:hypothetical protein [Bacteroidales bacterium]